ncbi:MAG TPA: zinc ribbon domain-containing protein [Elusimicrobiota bacterium]|nr:zinc ribbon domain-containing protein [Elusimicrobiota bacterium]
MELQAFTGNFADNSTEAGFQFTFFCDSCKEGYKTKFTESKSHKTAGLLRGLGQAAFTIANMLGKSGVGYGLERGADALREKYRGMSPEWHKEHEKAFELAQNEAKGHFKRCPKCKKWVCETDWNEQEGLCVDDAPRMNVEVAAAKAKKMVKDIQSAADTKQVFSGEIESKQTVCPQCGKPAGQGKFCNNCGADLSMLKCSKCGAQSPAGTRFCGNCGGKL